MFDYTIPIFAESLGKVYYPDKRVLTDVDLTVADGETIGILGNNGAGKTTLLRIFATLLFPSYGYPLYVGPFHSINKRAHISSNHPFPGLFPQFSQMPQQPFHIGVDNHNTQFPVQAIIAGN